MDLCFIVLREYFPRNPENAFYIDNSSVYTRMGRDNHDGTFTRAEPHLFDSEEAAQHYIDTQVILKDEVGRRTACLTYEEIQLQRVWIEEYDEQEALEHGFETYEVARHHMR